MDVRFMCGCMHTVEDPGFHTDDDGMLTCPIHGHRRYGWRSVGRDHSMDGWPALKVERWVVFGETLPVPEIHVHAPESINMREPDDVANWIGQKIDPDPAEIALAAEEARKRLDLWDRTGFEIRDAQV